MKKKVIDIKLVSIFVVFTLFLSFIVVWINLKVIDLSYSIQGLKKELKIQRELNEKLGIELSNMLSKKHLIKLAEKYGLKVPSPKKVRRVDLKF